MKKNLLILTAFTLTMSAVAQENNVELSSAEQNMQQKPIVQLSQQQKIGFKGVNKISGIAYDDIMTETPEGELHANQSLEDYGYTTVYGNIQMTRYSGKVVDYVIGNNGDFYLHNPFSNIRTDSWLRGTIKNDTISFPPQKIYKETYNGNTYEYYAVYMCFSANDQTWLQVPDSLDLTFVMHDDTLTQVGNGMIGLVDADNWWYGIGDMLMEITDVTDEIRTLPEGVTSDKYVLKYAYSPTLSDSKLMDIAIDGFNCYMGHMDDAMGDGYIWGMFAGNNLIVMPPQYLGIDTTFNNHIYYMASRVETKTNKSGKDYYAYYQANELIFNYDESKGQFSCDSALVINGGKSYISFIKAFNQPVMTRYEEKATTPRDPEFIDAMPFDYDNNYAYFTVRLPKYGTDNTFMDPEKLYYNIFFDGELYTFEPSLYTSLEQNMTDIPYNLSNHNFVALDPSARLVDYYDGDVETIGVQLIYKGGNETRKSNIVEIDINEFLETLGLKDVKADHKGIVSINYYDLSGREISQPSHGLYLKKITYQDGSVKTIKSIEK
ncbi:MAG: hypothetical protein ACOYJG_02820 [Prevotella sp.]|jgi:hypothetical protein